MCSHHESHSTNCGLLRIVPFSFSVVLFCLVPGGLLQQFFRCRCSLMAIKQIQFVKPDEWSLSFCSYYHFLAIASCGSRRSHWQLFLSTSEVDFEVGSGALSEVNSKVDSKVDLDVGSWLDNLISWLDSPISVLQSLSLLSKLMHRNSYWKLFIKSVHPFWKPKAGKSSSEPELH